MLFLDKLQRQINNLTDDKKFLVGFSGGMDSHVLLHSMLTLAAREKLTIRAAHIHHGLSKNADHWADHCQENCKKLGVECVVTKVNVRGQQTKKHGSEAVARRLRYLELGRILQPKESLLVAHHINDQAETLLLQLLRGTGISGLAAMPQKRKFADGFLLRPLLDFTRQELQEYAIAQNLNWIDDESNENIGISRNYIRHKLMPTICQRWPGALKTVHRVAQNCAAVDELLSEIAAQDYGIVCGSVANTLSISKLKQLSSARQNNIMRYWLRKLGLPTPASNKIEHIKFDLMQSRPDSVPCVHWPGVEVKRYRDDIYAMVPLISHDSSIVIPWDGKSTVKLPENLGVVSPKILEQLKIDITSVEKISIRFRNNGNPSHLKKAFQEKAIPPWLRNRVPLLCVEENGEEKYFIIW